mgnify:FL=1|jgi:hypothetical protein
MTRAKLLANRLGDVGLRSCQQDGETIGEVVPGCGGEWWTLLCDSGRKRFTEEVSALRSTCSKVEWRLLVADLAKLLKDAEKGLLIFDATNTRGEVCRPRGFKNCEDDKTRLDVQEVLELRIERTFNLNDRRRHLRLYYSEPSDQPGMLLHLHLAHKASRADGLAEQNCQIIEAQRRFNAWWPGRPDGVELILPL